MIDNGTPVVMVTNGVVGPTTELRSGIRTTEFWVAVVAQLLCAAAVVWSGSDVAKLGGMLGAALVSAGYGMARAKVKTGGV